MLRQRRGQHVLQRMWPGQLLRTQSGKGSFNQHKTHGVMLSEA